MSVAPPLFSHVPAALFGPLAGSRAPLYWSMLSTFYHHEFEREPFFLIRQIEDEGSSGEPQFPAPSGYSW